MKNILIITLSFLLPFGLYAQEKINDSKNRDSAFINKGSDEANAIKKDLGLTDKQHEQLKSVLDSFYLNMKKVNPETRSKENNLMRKQGMLSVYQQREQRIKDILTSEQLARYKAHIEERKKRMANDSTLKRVRIKNLMD